MNSRPFALFASPMSPPFDIPPPFEILFPLHMVGFEMGGGIANGGVKWGRQKVQMVGNRDSPLISETLGGGMDFGSPTIIMGGENNLWIRGRLQSEYHSENIFRTLVGIPHK